MRTAGRKRDTAFAAGTPYPERPDPKWNRIDAALTGAWAGFARHALGPWERMRLRRFAAMVEARGPALADLSDEALRAQADALRAPLVREGMRPALAIHQQQVRLLGEQLPRCD